MVLFDILSHGLCFYQTFPPYWMLTMISKQAALTFSFIEEVRGY